MKARTRRLLFVLVILIALFLAIDVSARETPREPEPPRVQVEDWDRIIGHDEREFFVWRWLRRFRLLRPIFL